MESQLNKKSVERQFSDTINDIVRNGDKKALKSLPGLLDKHFDTKHEDAMYVAVIDAVDALGEDHLTQKELEARYARLDKVYSVFMKRESDGLHPNEVLPEKELVETIIGEIPGGRNTKKVDLRIKNVKKIISETLKRTPEEFSEIVADAMRDYAESLAENVRTGGYDNDYTEFDENFVDEDMVDMVVREFMTEAGSVFVEKWGVSPDVEWLDDIEAAVKDFDAWKEKISQEKDALKEKVQG